MSIATFSCILAIGAMCNLRDKEIDKIKCMKFEFYRGYANPLATGELSEDECRKIILLLVLITLLSGLLIAFTFNIINFLLCVLAFVTGLVYIYVNRVIIGNAFQGIAIYTYVTAICYPTITLDIIILAFFLSFYWISHNINNQIEDFEVEYGFENTVATVYGIRKAKIIGLLFLSFSTIGVVFYPFLVIPILVLFVTYIVNNKIIQEKLRKINFIILPLIIYIYIYI